MNSLKIIVFTWVRGHSGVQGNEMADTLAREAAQDDQTFPTSVPFPHSYIKLLLKRDLYQQWQRE